MNDTSAPPARYRVRVGTGRGRKRVQVAIVPRRRRGQIAGPPRANMNGA